MGNISSDLPKTLVDKNTTPVLFRLTAAAGEFLPSCSVSCLALQQHSGSCEERDMTTLETCPVKLVTEESQREFLIECFAGVSPHRMMEEQKNSTSVAGKWSIMDPAVPIPFFHVEDIVTSSALESQNNEDEADENEGLVKTTRIQIKTCQGQAALQGIRLCGESLSATSTCCFRLLDISSLEIFSNHRLVPIYIDVDLS